MICGEYAVLGGSTSFVLPTKAGQSLKVSEHISEQDRHIDWVSYDKNGNIWFQCKLILPHLISEYSSNLTISIQLIRFLTIAKVLNPSFLTGNVSYKVETHLEFDIDEGLGSSSTLTNNIAQWADINPFSLHFNAFKGSGFDVAMAMKGRPILYTMNGSNPVIDVVDWNKSFIDKLYFIHLNKKQISRNEISVSPQIAHSILTQVSRISRLISANDDYFEFCLLLELAENEIARALNRHTIKHELFSDFNGTVKSLGAWGGDYILATGKDTENYFKSKGYNRIVPFKDMILT
ncbi:MAG: GHMP kinase [Bacteroidia bacterium]|nr:GHMP kinase [Bacteroidia bacterium]